MNANDQELTTLIRETLLPLGEPPSAIDLWPRLERRLGAGRTSVGRVDWFLAAVVLGLLAGFPEAVLLVLYHL
jgi:hypothetical protein